MPRLAIVVLCLAVSAVRPLPAQEKEKDDVAAAPAAVPADLGDGKIWEKIKSLLRGSPPAAPGTPAPAPPFSPPPPPVPPVVPPAPPAPIVEIVSWNLQTFGKHIKAERKRASAKAIEAIFKDGEAKLLAAQEIADEQSAETVESELDADGKWTRSFENSADSMDNGFFVRDGASIDCSGFVFSDRSKSRHPARVAHVRVGELDFTIITVHLAFDGSHADSSLSELRNVVDWVQAYLQKPGADPDVIIAGDFNLPTRAGKAASHRANQASWEPVEDVLDQYPSLGLTALVDEPTSRTRGEAANNYDHFIVSKHLADTAFVRDSAHRLPEEPVLAVEAAEGVKVSDHFPIAARFRAGGLGNDGRPISLDGGRTCPF
jgi:endonuclease/exonuclease/phosphatase family metal-dependent hydrolase